MNELPASWRGRKVVLFAHWLSERKGVQFLPDIIEKTYADFEDVLFVIVGGGHKKTWLEDEVGRRNLGDCVCIVGEVPNYRIHEYYWVADVFIMPSVEEGFPRVLLESMAAGVPFVAMDANHLGRSSVLDVVSELQKRFIVSTGDVEGFVYRLKMLLGDWFLRQQLIVDGNIHVKKYTTENSIKRFIEIIGG